MSINQAYIFDLLKHAVAVDVQPIVPESSLLSRIVERVHNRLNERCKDGDFCER